MKRRIEKKIAKAKRREVLELLDLAMRKNEGKPSVFFNFSGHVNMVSISIHKDGWPNEVTYNAQRFIDKNFSSDATLDETKNALEAL